MSKITDISKLSVLSSADERGFTSDGEWFTGRIGRSYRIRKHFYGELKCTKKNYVVIVRQYAPGIRLRMLHAYEDSPPLNTEENARRLFDFYIGRRENLKKAHAICIEYMSATQEPTPCPL